MVLAALVHRHAPAGEPVDLFNVSFAPAAVSPDAERAAYETAPDRITARLGAAELR